MMSSLAASLVSAESDHFMSWTVMFRSWMPSLNISWSQQHKQSLPEVRPSSNLDVVFAEFPADFAVTSYIAQFNATSVPGRLEHWKLLCHCGLPCCRQHGNWPRKASKHRC